MKTKILFFICLFIGMAFLFCGCTEKNSLVPGLTQEDDLILKSKKIPTQFAGTCANLNYKWDDGSAAFYDEATDERVTGVSRWYTVKYEQINDVTFSLAGTAEIFVGAVTVEDVNNGNYIGKWYMTWEAIQTLFASPAFRIMGHGDGTGMEGEVFGLTARWKYTMNFDGSPESFIYVSKGKITEPF